MIASVDCDQIAKKFVKNEHQVIILGICSNDQDLLTRN